MTKRVVLCLCCGSHSSSARKTSQASGTIVSTKTSWSESQVPDIGDYLGIPINAAARLHGDSWDASLLTLPEHQCKPHPSDYGIRGPAQMRVWKEVDILT